MTTKNFLFAVTLALALFVFNACKEKIDIDIPGANPILVVESEVTTELDSSYVKLSSSSNYFGNPQYPIVENASITVNGTVFSYKGNGMYRPAPGFIGKVDSVYNLKIVYNGKEYTASSKLEPMFRVDSIFQTFKPADAFLDEGFALSYAGFDTRSPIKYTYFQSGYFDTIAQKDSFINTLVLFDNSVTPIGVPYDFEFPFSRFQKGEEFFCIFRSVDKPMNDFLLTFSEQSSGAPRPFQTPPANLPTNIKGGAVGYFACYDVVRKRYVVK